jgi:hypothetical protein
LLLLGTAFVAAAVRLAWPTGPSAVIADAQQRYAKLLVGMPAAEAEDALGPPRVKDKLYGQWFEWTHWYATIHPRDCPNPSPDQKLYDWYQWDFEQVDGWTSEWFTIGALLDHGGVVCFWFLDDRQSLAERTYKKHAWRLGIDTSTYSTVRTGISHDNMTDP